MKLKEYKENIVSWYENRKEWLLMYKHQKLFDISNFIKQVVDIWIEWKLTTKEYMEKVGELFQKMPEEFKEQYKDKYDEFILAHEKTKNDIAYHTREISKEERNSIFKFLKAIIGWGPLFSDKRAFLKLSDALSVKNDDIDVTQHGVATVVSLPEEYWNKEYWEDRGWFKYLKKWGKIYIKRGGGKDIIDHEYTHVLHCSGLLTEYKDVIRYLKNKTKKDFSVLNSLLKDEFLARMSGGIDSYMKEYWTWKGVIIVLLIPYLWKYIKEMWFDENLVVGENISEKIDEETWRINYSIDVYQEKNWEIKSPSEKTQNLLLEKIKVIKYMYQTYEKLYKICVSKYYPHEDQFHYMLAFTPLSQWEEVLRTYQEIEKIEKTKSDIADTFSSEKNKSK